MRSFIFTFIFLLAPITHASQTDWRKAAVQKIEDLGYSNYNIVKELETDTSVVFLKRFAKDIDRGDSQTCHLGVIVNKRSNLVTSASDDEVARDYLLIYGPYSETNEDVEQAIFWLCAI